MCFNNAQKCNIINVVYHLLSLLQMCINRYKTLARFGLMHIISTNVCVWLRFICVETLHYLQLYSRNRPSMSEVTKVPQYISLATLSEWDDSKEQQTYSTSCERVCLIKNLACLYSLYAKQLETHTHKFMQHNLSLPINEKQIHIKKLVRAEYIHTQRVAKQCFPGAAPRFLPEIECHWDALMGRVLEKVSSYLYPCTIQYSLICGSK